MVKCFLLLITEIFIINYKSSGVQGGVCKWQSAIYVIRDSISAYRLAILIEEVIKLGSLMLKGLKW